MGEMQEVGQLAVGQKNQAILQWILNFVFCICLAFGAWDLGFSTSRASPFRPFPGSPECHQLKTQSCKHTPLLDIPFHSSSHPSQPGCFLI